MSAPRALAAAGLVALAGCASMPRVISSADLDARDRRILDLERQGSLVRAENAELRRRLAELERDCAAATTPAPPVAPFAPQPLAAEPLEDQPATPAPRVAIEESDLVEAQAAPAAGGTAASPSAARYEAALVALRDGRTGEAERALREFAESEPGSDLADNAWFWLAESQLARGELAGAIEAYRTAIDRHSEGNKIPDALLKLGVALERQGDVAAAREAWRELVRRFPTTAAAEAAADRLDPP